MNKYNTSIIYKIYCKDPKIKEFYIGSTINFNRRHRCHKHQCNNENFKYHNRYVYQYIRNNGGWDNFVMEKLKVVYCSNKKELCIIERSWCDALNPALNRYNPYRSLEEKKMNYKDYIQKYRKKNKDKINKQQRENYAKRKNKNKNKNIE